MTFEELTKETGDHISFEQILEPRTNEVKLRIIVNKSENPTDLLIFPHPDSKVKTLQIDFKNYVTYSVIYDDFTTWNNTETFQGEAFRIYQQSNYLDRIHKESKEKLTHYSLACIDHKVDVISRYEPTIIEIDSTGIK
ncbi:hypothetical protein SAMN05192533_103318 [Mesobacillus persicus]|uniref:Uncharacterized protein n=1 Tax=Mesobacillus persicus TaxID=930146 RepID=A0A1H7ZBI6_9BACI|nr:hypothetical protein [Mesobacillus persicus]SEM54859.1 hypothetical protein SAMN05192533_103318 [Mesobacillus persicus]